MRLHFPNQRLLFVAVLAVALGTPSSAALGQETISVRGLVVRDDLSGAQIERVVLRSEGLAARRYRALTGMFVLRAPSEDAWNEVVAPALQAAIDSARPIEALRSTMLGMGDALIGSPDESAIRMSFDLPGDRGQGAVALAAPVLLGPQDGKTSHVAVNRFRVVTGVQVDPVSGRRPAVVEAIGLPNVPSSWTGDALRLADLEALPYGGEGGWAKHKGKIAAEGDESDSAVLEKLSERVKDLAERASLRVDRLLSWPGRIGDEMDLTDTLRSVRYDSRVLSVDRRLEDELRRPEGSLKWRDKRVKHPTRFGIVTLPLGAEVVAGRKLVERTEIFACVYFYTPLFVSFNQSHLYLSVTPEVLVRAVQAGELPFFLRGDKAYFYLGHLDRWLSGQALEVDGSLTSRKRVSELAGRWAEDLDRKLAREVRSRGENPEDWPLRMVARDDDGGNAYKVRVSLADLGSWFHRLKSAVRPDVPLLKPVWTVNYKGESGAYRLGVLFGGGRVVLEEGAGQVSSLGGGQAEEEEEVRVTIEPEVRSGGRRAGAVTRESSVDLRMKKVTVGSPEKGKPYLLTRAGRTVPVKVTFTTGGAGKGHKARVVAEVFDPSGAAMKDFRSRSGAVTLKDGEGSITTYLKVPKSLYNKQGAYKVRTHLELDGSAQGGAREEFLYLGSALTMKRMELDPSVVVPGEEVVLIMDLALAGWRAGESVPLQVDLGYVLGGVTHKDSFRISRTVGSHQLEVDLRVPEELTPGDGTYKVRVSSSAGPKTEKNGKLRVFARELVEAGLGRRRAGPSLRVEDDDSELLAAARAAKAAKVTVEREVVRAERADEPSEDLFDDADFGESAGDEDRQDEPAPEPEPESDPEFDDEELVADDEDLDLDLDFGEGPPEPSRSSSRVDEEEDDYSLDFDADGADEADEELAPARRERKQQPRRSFGDDDDDGGEGEPRRLSEGERRREQQRRRQQDARRGGDDGNDFAAQRRDEESRRDEEQRRLDEEARRDKEERRRAAKSRKAEEKRRREAERDRDEEVARRAAPSSDSGAGDSWGTDRRRRSTKPAPRSRERRPKRRSSESDFDDASDELYEDEEEDSGARGGGKKSAASDDDFDDEEFSGSSYDEDEESLSSSYDEEEEFSGSSYDEDEELDLDSDTGSDSKAGRSGSRSSARDDEDDDRSSRSRERRSRASDGEDDQGERRRGRARGKSSSSFDEDDEGDESSGGQEQADGDPDYWLDGSREDPDAMDGGRGHGRRGRSEEVRHGRSLSGLPVGVYSEDEESNAVSRAQRRSMGIVWVYGGSEEALKRWFNLYEGLLEDGGRTWIWIFSEGSGGGELRFKRYASDRESWATVYRVPSALADEDGMRQMRREVLEVLDGYIPKLDRKVKFGRF